jgi:dynein heavy chain
LKKVNNPVPAVELALKCTLIYLGYAKHDWPVAQKALADMKFLDRLRNYEKDSIPEVLLTKIKNLTEKPEFNIETMTRASKAAGGLAKWCYAIRIYAETQIVVKPLLEKQLVMTAKYDQAQIEV